MGFLSRGQNPRSATREGGTSGRLPLTTHTTGFVALGLLLTPKVLECAALGMKHWVFGPGCGPQLLFAHHAVD